MTPRNQTLMILLILFGIIGTIIGMAYTMIIYGNRYGGFESGGICYHKPQDVVDHVIEPKHLNRYEERALS